MALLTRSIQNSNLIVCNLFLLRTILVFVAVIDLLFLKFVSFRNETLTSIQNKEQQVEIGKHDVG